ncbi:MAG TPA: hypothetical protein VLT33_00880, partial [Labilithrix sp.]|nr:hypothetical protein [Labilithrix sp.]
MRSDSSSGSRSFAGLTMVIPDGWSDVTDDLPAGTPCTLARPDGIGALQFSRAHYRGGVVPEITVEDLESLLE